MKYLNILFKEKNYKLFFYLLLLTYLLIGIFFSVNTGITADESIEQRNWLSKLELIKSYFENSKTTSFNPLDINHYFDRGLTMVEYDLRFYGIGFHYFSQIYLFIISLIFNFNNFSADISKILLNHSFIFFNFFLSGIFAGKILYLIIKDKFYTRLFILLFLLYPYLLGHGFYNPKDTPFMFAWILSTYISLKFFLKIKNTNKITALDVIFLSISTSYLFSVRITGILILLQYLISFMFLISTLKITFYSFFKIYFYKILLFVFFTSLLTVFLYPILWKNPLLIFDIINQMRNYPFGVCTLTLGKCMESVDLPSSYIFIWFFFKLPILFFIALILFPFVEKHIFLNTSNQITLGSILLSCTMIILLLVFFNVNLHGEIRHLLFLVSLLLISSFSIIYFYSKKFLKYFTLVTIIIFTIQNINMYPYQYTWFNLFGNFVNINKNFDLDYWGVSGRNLAKQINKNNKIKKIRNNCIYVSPEHLIKPFINTNYKCIKHLTSIYPKSSEKYILVKYTREISREHPSECKLIYTEGYKYNMFGDFLNMGEIYVCN